MTPEQLFDIWAPAASVWSPWVKPVLFAHWSDAYAIDSLMPSVSFNVEPKPDDAIVIDLPADEGVHAGMVCAAVGFRPVPLYNAAPVAGGPLLQPLSVLNVSLILSALGQATPQLAGLALPSAAPPAFLMDSRRSFGAPRRPGLFDNRSVSLPTDFPSGLFLHQHGIRRVLLITAGDPYPQPDLSHTLRRWQDQGIPIFSQPLTSAEPPARITVRRPSWYRTLAYNLLATAGLKPNRLGGYGGILPMPTTG